jgi:hypothetical protein
MKLKIVSTGSGIETPEALNAVNVIPQRDLYLESMLVRASTVSEMVKQCGLSKSFDPR